MPLIKARAHRVAIVRHICRLSQPNRDALVLYARFIGDTPDYVLNRLLETTIAKDHDFLAWRAEHPAETVATSSDRARPRARRRHPRGARGRRHPRVTKAVAGHELRPHPAVSPADRRPHPGPGHQRNHGQRLAADLHRAAGTARGGDRRSPRRAQPHGRRQEHRPRPRRRHLRGTADSRLAAPRRLARGRNLAPVQCRRHDSDHPQVSHAVLHGRGTRAHRHDDARRAGRGPKRRSRRTATS